MSYAKTYAEILEMMRDAMLDTGMCRDIVRRAGLRWGATAGGRGPSLLATVDPDGSVVSSTSSVFSVDVVYNTLVYDTGLGFDPDIAAPYSWEVPVDGIYRIDATAAVWRDSHLAHDRIYLEMVFGSTGTSFERRFNYSSAAMSVDDPVVCRGTSVENLQAGWTLRFLFGRNWDALPGHLVDIEIRPDPSLSRLTIQRLATAGE